MNEERAVTMGDDTQVVAPDCGADALDKPWRVHNPAKMCRRAGRRGTATGIRGPKR